MITAKTRYNELVKIQKTRNYKHGWVFYKMKNEFGQNIANRFCKRYNSRQRTAKTINSNGEYNNIYLEGGW